MNRELLVKMLIEISELEGAGVFQEEDGTISFNGMNQKTYDEYRKRKGLPPKDVRNIKVNETVDILEQEFINRNGIERIPTQHLPLVVDMSFNSGAGNAAKIFQRTVGAEEDGIIGPKTMAKYDEFIKENDFINAYSQQRAEFIATSEKPSVVKNRNGLLNRVESVRLREIGKREKRASGDVIADNNLSGSGVTAKE